MSATPTFISIGNADQIATEKSFLDDTKCEYELKEMKFSMYNEPSKFDAFLATALYRDKLIDNDPNVNGYDSDVDDDAAFVKSCRQHTSLQILSQ
ncbi:MAG: hypothetical protein Faunusvirus2_18 [Faunusvirus sp.]|jgi:hypothetical protein|uniref:Uncharacterized protein n=1 Tax=Faunusvirus sp. TaxID=2487766 RepID=A0A3G4ZYJ2_9VIRU|nr:MAG: hypothetical protein Faunusvirus2_18 [Faunusvirus sp.]